MPYIVLAAADSREYVAGSVLPNCVWSILQDRAGSVLQDCVGSVVNDCAGSVLQDCAGSVLQDCTGSNLLDGACSVLLAESGGICCCSAGETFDLLAIPPMDNLYASPRLIDLRTVAGLKGLRHSACLWKWSLWFSSGLLKMVSGLTSPFSSVRKLSISIPNFVTWIYSVSLILLICFNCCCYLVSCSHSRVVWIGHKVTILSLPLAMKVHTVQSNLAGGHAGEVFKQMRIPHCCPVRKHYWSFQFFIATIFFLITEFYYMITWLEIRTGSGGVCFAPMNCRTPSVAE